MKTLQRLLLLLLLASAAQLARGYEYFKIHFHDGTKSEPFYSASVDSIRYSKIDLDSVACDTWVVQEVWCPDSVYRYRIADIDSLGFVDVNIDRVAQDLARVGAYIIPIYMDCNSSYELEERVRAAVEQMDGVEDLWTDNQSLFVKIRDYGTTTYTYPPTPYSPVVEQAPKPNFINTRRKEPASANGQTPKHIHKDVKNICFAFQMSDDEKFNKDYRRTDSVKNELRKLGFNANLVDRPNTEFFLRDIRNYDLVLLDTHGIYDHDNSSHWLATGEKIYTYKKGDVINMDSLNSVEAKHLENYYYKKNYSPSEIKGSFVEELHDKDTIVVQYVWVSSKLISKQLKPESKNVLVINGACMSMMGDKDLNDQYEMAEAFNKSGVDYYIGYTDVNRTAGSTIYGMSIYMANGNSIYNAALMLPENLRKDDFEYPEGSNNMVHPRLSRWPIDTEYDYTCITPVETLDSEVDKNERGDYILLKGGIKTMNSYDIEEYGFLYSENSEPDETNAEYIRFGDPGDFYKYDKANLYFEFTKAIDPSNLKPGTTYYYRAVLYDGESLCLGDVKSFETQAGKAYAVLNDSTLTFYYDDKQAERVGTVYEIAERYTGYHNDFNDYPGWSNGTFKYALFDESIVNYRPTSTAYWFNNCKKLTSIHNLQYLNTSNVTNMRSMFNVCISLTSLDISSFDTSNVTDMSCMLYLCKALSLDLSHFNTSNVTDMSWMFAYCNSLTSLDVSNFDTSNVTDMAGMFSGCSSLTSLDLSSFDTSKVTDMHGMFGSCSSLTSLDLSNFNTSNVTDMSGMFGDCSSLTSLDLSHFDTSNVTSMSQMFLSCSSLTSLDLSSFDTSNVTSMGGMFCNWSGHSSSLMSLDLSSFDTSNVTSMGGMFELCNALTSLDLSSFDTSNVTSMEGMFSGCSSLTSLDLSSFNASNVTDMSIMFGSCSSLTSLDLSSFNASSVTNMSHMFTECSSLEKLDMSNFDFSNIKKFSDWPFYGYSNNLKTVIMRNCVITNSLFTKNIEYIDLTNSIVIGNFSFQGFSLLKELNLSNFDMSNATNMQQMFMGCSSLTSLDLSSFDTSNVTNMRYMFYGCSSLTSLNVSSFNTSNVTDMSGMFVDCSSLTSLDVSNFNTSNVTDMSGMFVDCSSLTSLDLSSFDTSKVTDMSGMFGNSDYNLNSSLTNLDLSSFNTLNVTTMRAMFKGCRSLTSLDLRQFKMSDKINDTGYMFAGCFSLKTIYAGNWSDFINTNYNYMFKDCIKLSGGQGTKIGQNLYGYDAQGNPLYYNCPNDARAAHIDGGKDNPGLFTP